MAAGRGGTLAPENMLGVSWHDSSWLPILNASNVLDYFSERSNPFYDRTCNNELIKMQRISPEQLVNMTGVEYMLLHAQEPILYVVRKLHRSSPTQITPLADYYIIAGTVYQAPDLASVIGGRLLSSSHHLQSAMQKMFNMTKYFASKGGYMWDVKTQGGRAAAPSQTKDMEPVTKFQSQRTDMLLAELTRTWMNPPPMPQSQPSKNPQVGEVKSEPEQKEHSSQNTDYSSSTEPPPEKKPKLE